MSSDGVGNVFVESIMSFVPLNTNVGKLFVFCNTPAIMINGNRVLSGLSSRSIPFPDWSYQILIRPSDELTNDWREARSRFPSAKNPMSCSASSEVLLILNAGPKYVVLNCLREYAAAAPGNESKRRRPWDTTKSKPWGGKISGIENPPSVLICWASSWPCGGSAKKRGVTLHLLLLYSEYQHLWL